MFCLWLPFFLLSRFGYQMVSKPVQNTVVIDLSSNNQLTGSTCVDESQSILKCMIESTCSGSGAGLPILVQRSIARQVTENFMPKSALH